MSAEAEPDARPPPGGLRRTVIVVAAGIFLTGFGWPGVIGRLPFSLFLKDQLNLPAHRVAAFWAIATIAWYCKPLVGLICDAYPLFGTRRRGYMLAGASLAGLFWLAFAFVPPRYVPFMLVMTALNLALVFTNTVVGGLLVETGQRAGATGRLSGLREAVEGVVYVVGGPISGLLAVRAFGWTAVTGAAVVLSFVPVVALLYREPRSAPLVVERAVWSNAWRQLKSIVRSRPMWGASLLLFLYFLAPGFQTPLLYHQTNVLKFDPRFIGVLYMLGGAGMLVGAGLYSVVCRYVPLRTSLIAGVLLTSATTMFFLLYDSAVSAGLIHFGVAVLQTMAVLPLYDLSIRATPKGSESFGFGLMMSIRNIAVFLISDVVGSYLYAQHHLGFKQLVWLNAGSTLVVLFFVPLLPAALLAAREGGRTR